MSAQGEISKDIRPMEALLVDALPEGEQWRYEPKWDGFRCLAFKHEETVDLVSKSGKPLNRYFPDIVAMLASLPARQFVIDGELVIGNDEAYSFSELQLRLHPAASRVARLAEEAPASFVLFDLLMDEKGSVLLDRPFAQRRKGITQFVNKHKKQARLLLSTQTDSLQEATAWLKSHEYHIDGVVAKDINATYQPGKRIMQKYKALKTADCVVGGFRYGSNSRLVASLLLGLYGSDGKLNHVGYTSALKGVDKKGLTRELEQLIAPPGFSGNAPGGPSRWSTERSAEWQPLQPILVVEVKYDHVSDERFRHGTTFLRWRADKEPGQCTMDQILKN